MTRSRVVSVLFFLLALALFLVVRFWRTTPDTNLTGKQAVAGTYVLDKEALMEAVLSPKNPGRQIVEMKRKDALEAIKLLPRDKAIQARKDLDVLVANLEMELRRKVKSLTETSVFDLELIEDGTFREKIVAEGHGLIGQGRWTVQNDELHLVLERLTTLEGIVLAFPEQSEDRLRLVQGKILVRSPHFPDDLTLIRKPSVK